MSLVKKINQLFKLTTLKMLLSPTRKEERRLRLGVVNIKEFIKENPKRFINGLFSFVFRAPAYYTHAATKIPRLIKEHRNEERAHNLKELAIQSTTFHKVTITLEARNLPKSNKRLISPNTPHDFVPTWESLESQYETIYGSITTPKNIPQGQYFTLDNPKEMPQGQEDCLTGLTC